MSLKLTLFFLSQSYGITSSVSIWNVPSVLPFSLAGVSSPGCAISTRPSIPPPATMVTGAPALCSAMKLVYGISPASTWPAPRNVTISAWSAS